jgi:hypothetical protein
MLRDNHLAHHAWDGCVGGRSGTHRLGTRGLCFPCACVWRLWRHERSRSIEWDPDGFGDLPEFSDRWGRNLWDGFDHVGDWTMPGVLLRVTRR